MRFLKLDIEPCTDHVGPLGNGIAVSAVVGSTSEQVIGFNDDFFVEGVVPKQAEFCQCDKDDAGGRIGNERGATIRVKWIEREVQVG